MKKTFFLLLFVCLLLFLSSCATNKQISHTSSHVRERDTTYINKVVYDSIYIDNWEVIDHWADTVFVEKLRTEYRYKLRCDTLYRTQSDTLYINNVVERTTEVPYTPPWMKWMAGIGLIALMWLVIRLRTCWR